MTPERHQHIKNIFLEVIELPKDAWPAALARACAGDDDLRHEVEVLLQCHVDMRDRLGVEPESEIGKDSSVWAAGARRPPAPPASGATPPARPSPSPRERSELPTEPGFAQPARERSPSPAIPLRVPADHAPAPAHNDSPRRPRSSIASEQGRFLPGTVIDNRYRIVALVGRGGMGEVYRADDLKLGTTVALKFLPSELAERPARMQSLIDEVRTARAVSHPNVVRVYDIGEHKRELFISMEFVDGETLDTLMSRIGQLPEKKAEQIAQQLCAGLAAIHDAGVLHRDLKPSNVMIDGRGQVRVNDFGLASVKDVYGLEAIAGTPGFVPPESLSGKSATIRSDIYALGLVLYELFTGVPAYRGRTREDLIREQETLDPDSPLMHAPDLPPEIADAIMQCLSRDPAERPRSAREVAGLLPGGDPLAAAMAAGDTPSPALVAASGRKGVLTPWQAIAAMVAFLGVLAMTLMLGQYGSLIRRVSLPKSPDVLAEHSRDILRTLGYGEPLSHEAYTLDLYDEWLDELQRKESTGKRADRLSRDRPAAIDFWYRSSKSPLLPRNPQGKITYYDPTIVEQGMILLRLSPAGRLRELAVVSNDLYWPSSGLVRAESAPAGVSDEPKPPVEPDYEPAFKAAGLDMRKFVPVDPKRIPPVYAEHRAAWVGVYPESPDEPVQVEIASADGKIVAFRTVELNWQGSQLAIPRLSLFTKAQEIGLALFAIAQAASLVGAMVLARRNIRERRGDQTGAARLATFVCVTVLLHGLLSADTLSSQNVWFGITGWVVARALAMGVAAWLLYIGFEPYVRRVWPEILVSWSRLVDGRWRDPLVGQSVLLGGVCGCVIAALIYINRSIPTWVGGTPAIPYYMGEFDLDALGNLSASLGVIVHVLLKAVQVAMGFVALLALSRLIFKRQWLALLAWFVVQTAILVLGPNAYTGWWSVPIVAGMVGIGAVILLRNGLLGLIALSSVVLVLVAGPITMDEHSWFYERSAATLVVLCAIMTVSAVFAAIAPPQKNLLSGSGTARPNRG